MAKSKTKKRDPNPRGWHRLERARSAVCPFCASRNTAYDNIQVDFGMANQTAECADCDAKWEEIYRLVEVRRT